MPIMTPKVVGNNSMKAVVVIIQLFNDDHAVSRMSTVGALILLCADLTFWFIHVPCSSTTDVVAGDLPQ